MGIFTHQSVIERNLCGCTIGVDRAMHCPVVEMGGAAIVDNAFALLSNANALKSNYCS